MYEWLSLHWGRFERPYSSVRMQFILPQRVPVYDARSTALNCRKSLIDLGTWHAHHRDLLGPVKSKIYYPSRIRLMLIAIACLAFFLSLTINPFDGLSLSNCNYCVIWFISISNPESISVEIEKKCNSIFPLQNVFIRKVKVLKKPRFDLTKLMEMHGDIGAEDTGEYITRSYKFVISETLYAFGFTI